MKRFPFILSLSLATLLFTSCEKITGEGPTVTESRSVSGFSEIKMAVPGDLVFKQESQYKMEVQAQKNVLEVMETTVKGNQLLIRFKNDVRVKTHEPILITVSAPDISLLRMMGSGNLQTVGSIHSDDLRLDVEGSGSITVPQLAGKKFEANISGSGDIFINSGTAESEDLRISGSGSIDLLNVPAKSATTHTSGSGTIKVKLSEKLNTTISGSGKVYYRGNPVITTNISGSGKVEPM